MPIQSLQTAKPETQMALMPLFIAIIICTVVSIYPRILVGAHGQADHTVASILFWSMSAGFIRGVGYIPKFWLFRYMFSQYACYIACAAALYLLAVK